MVAVIKTGGKQYLVALEQSLDVERSPGEVGDQVTFDQVLMTSEGDQTVVGTPFVSGCRVVAEVVEQKRAPKVYHQVS